MKKNKNKKLIKLADKFFPWDFGFNLEIEREMFNRMYKYFSSGESVTVKDEDIARYAKLAVNLLDIINEVDSSLIFNNGIWSNTKYINVRNVKRFIKGKDSEDITPLIKDFLRVEKAWYLYNKLRFDRMRDMWD